MTTRRERAGAPISPEDAFIRRLDPDWLSTVADLGNVVGEVAELTKSSHRQERYLVGGWNDDGTVWIEGVREKLERVDKTTRWFWAIAAGVWTGVAGIIYGVIHGGVIRF